MNEGWSLVEPDAKSEMSFGWRGGKDRQTTGIYYNHHIYRVLSLKLSLLRRYLDVVRTHHPIQQSRQWRADGCIAYGYTRHV